MYIENIVINNIRSLSRLEMRFEEPTGWHVVIGDNGSGKSSLIRAIAAVLIGPAQISAVGEIWSEWLRQDTKQGIIELEIRPNWEFDAIGRGRPSNKNNVTNCFRLHRRESGEVLLSTNADIQKHPPTNYNWGNNAGWFSVAYGPFRRFTGGDERRNKIYYASPKAGAHLSAFGEEIALTEALDWLKELDRRRLKEKESQSANTVQEEQSTYFNRDAALYDNIRAFINQSGLLPHEAIFEGIDIDGDVIFKDGNGKVLKAHQLSDGYRSVLSLMFELIRQLVHTYGAEKVFEYAKVGETGEIQIAVPGVVLIDEIDAHLHPTWQTRIGQWFTQYFPKIQFIVTTHSPLICRASQSGTIWRLAAPGSETASAEVTGIAKERLVFGNILDAYGTEVFGTSPVRSVEGNEKLRRLGKLNMKAAFGQISTTEEKERKELQKIFQTDATIG